MANLRYQLRLWYQIPLLYSPSPTQHNNFFRNLPLYSVWKTSLQKLVTLTWGRESRKLPQLALVFLNLTCLKNSRHPLQQSSTNARLNTIMIESQAFHMAAEITFNSPLEIVRRPSHDVNCIPLCLPNLWTLVPMVVWRIKFKFHSRCFLDKLNFQNLNSPPSIRSSL